jgi:hypothetical protein
MPRPDCIWRQFASGCFFILHHCKPLLIGPIYSLRIPSPPAAGRLNVSDKITAFRYVQKFFVKKEQTEILLPSPPLSFW